MVDRHEDSPKGCRPEGPPRVLSSGNAPLARGAVQDQPLSLPRSEDPALLEGLEHHPEEGAKQDTHPLGPRRAAVAREAQAAARQEGEGEGEGPQGKEAQEGEHHCPHPPCRIHRQVQDHQGRAAANQEGAYREEARVDAQLAGMAGQGEVPPDGDPGEAAHVRAGRQRGEGQRRQGVRRYGQALLRGLPARSRRPEGSRTEIPSV
mmetsp:Transcript_32374/g.78914  ORF Transcript_32374/g.78914 Transcript_32374/m.78914 type:complete len:206 (+) Transcript_32374:831-1448(+)